MTQPEQHPSLMADAHQEIIQLAATTGQTEDEIYAQNAIESARTAALARGQTILGLYKDEKLI